MTRLPLRAAGLLLLTRCLLPGAPEKTTIIVEVRNQYQKPVDNAAVVLDFLSTRQVIRAGFKKKMHWEVRTNGQGLAHFPPVPEGTIQLQVITQKYQTFGQRIDIAGPEKKVEVELKPPQSQYSAHEPLKPTEPKNDAPK